MSAKQEFIKLMQQNCKVQGLDSLTSKLISILYVEPKELSLNQLSKKTRYSLSAVSTALKLIEQIGLVNKIRKPGSKKVYYYMEKNMMDKMMELAKIKYEKVVLKTKKQLPGIIKKYKKENYSKKEIKIAEDYYKQILFAEKILKKIIKMFEDV